MVRLTLFGVAPPARIVTSVSLYAMRVSMYARVLKTLVMDEAHSSVCRGSGVVSADAGFPLGRGEAGAAAIGASQFRVRRASARSLRVAKDSLDLRPDFRGSNSMFVDTSLV